MELLAISSKTWINLGVVAAIFAGTAIIIGLLILLVGKVFKVDVDEKVTKILENLAGANCGLSIIHIRRCRRSYACRSRWSPYH